MVYDYFDKHTFLCEMYDKEADTIRNFVLDFFPFDNSVRIVDTKKSKILLRRVHLPPLKLEMLQVGNIVNIFSKLLYITDCAPITKRTIFNKFEKTFALIKPVESSVHGKVITFITNKGFRITRMKNAKVDKEFGIELYRSIAGNSMMPIIINYITSGEVIGLELEAADAVRRWRQCLGATDPREAEPGTLRAICGENMLRNVAHGCNTLEDANKMLELFFGRDKGALRIPFRATMKECSCCVIKPHAIIDGNVGSIIEHIATSGNLYLSAMAMFSVGLNNSKEFYEVYKGVLPEYEAMCNHLSEGSCIALEVKAVDPKVNVVCELRKLCGPRDPELCRQLYPDSIRALYGKSILYNAVHCTDLPEDGAGEVEYFFKLLAGGDD